MYPTEKQGGVKQMDYSIVITSHILKEPYVWFSWTVYIKPMRLKSHSVISIVNHARIRACNQPVLSNEGTRNGTRKHYEPLMGFELK